MPSTFTSNTGLEKPADGEKTGVWGQIVNLNYNIIDRALNGVGTITLSGTTHTLTTSNALLSDGQFGVIVFAGSPSGTNTVTIAPNTAQKVYWVRNTTSQIVVLTQGSGGNVSVPAGTSKIVYTTGSGSGSAVVDLTGILSGNLTGSFTGTLTGSVTGNLTGNLTGDVTGNVTGNSDTATALATSRDFTIGDTTRSFNGTADVSWTLGDIGVNNNTLTLATSGIASGSQTWTANSGVNRTFTVTVPGTNLGSSGTGGTRSITSSTGSNTSITFTASDLGAVPTGRTITAGTGLSGGGTLAADRTISITNGGVGTAQLASDERMTTSNVLSAVSGAAVGAVGTYAFLYDSGAGVITAAGSTRAGSQLRYGGVYASAVGNSTDLGGSTTTPSGTWRAMGDSRPTGSRFGATVWLRIS